MTGHTPGPWHRGQGNGEGSIFSKQGRMRMTGSGTGLWPICKMQTGWNQAEDDANARLVAAAPDLLAACMNVVKCWETGDLAAAVRACDAACEAATSQVRR